MRARRSIAGGGPDWGHGGSQLAPSGRAAGVIEPLLCCWEPLSPNPEGRRCDSPRRQIVCFTLLVKVRMDWYGAASEQDPV
jgi:hypothetical protein